MDRPKILATHRLFEEPRAKLAEHFDVEYWSDSDRPSRAEVLRRVADKDGLICLLTEKIDEELLAAAPRLRTVANIAVGFDNIDVEACTRHNVAASNTPGVLDETTADFAWTLLMAVARRLIEGDAVLREADFLSLHVPLLPATRGLIGARELALMKPTAFLINTSRGPVVQEAALIAALEGRQIAGAALDVYEREPQIGHGLLRPNVVLAPHLASA